MIQIHTNMLHFLNKVDIHLHTNYAPLKDQKEGVGCP